MSIFDAITHAVKKVAGVAIETAVPILPHDIVEDVVDALVDTVTD